MGTHRTTADINYLSPIKTVASNCISFLLFCVILPSAWLPLIAALPYQYNNAALRQDWLQTWFHPAREAQRIQVQLLSDQKATKFLQPSDFERALLAPVHSPTADELQAMQMPGISIP